MAKGLRQTGRIKRGTTRKLLREMLGSRGSVPIRTGRRAGVGQKKPSVPNPPPTWKGTLPEWAIFWAHLQIGRKPDEDFVYLYKIEQAPNGIDFFELDLNIGIEIQGLYWHYAFGAAAEVNDLERRSRIESVGIQLIMIDEDDALKDPVFYLQEALQGRDHSMASQGAA